MSAGFNQLTQSNPFIYVDMLERLKKGPTIE